MTWQSVIGQNCRVQSKAALSDPAWTDLAGDVLATNALATKTDAFGGTNRFYRVRMVP